MDIRVAAASTRLTVTASDPSNWPPHGPLSQTHVEDMLERIDSGEIAGEKAHRWLGWAQAACVAAGAGTLDDMKEINHDA